MEVERTCRRRRRSEAIAYRSRHRPDRNPAAQQSPAVPMCAILRSEARETASSQLWGPECDDATSSQRLPALRWPSSQRQARSSPRSGELPLPRRDRGCDIKPDHGCLLATAARTRLDRRWQSLSSIAGRRAAPTFPRIRRRVRQAQGRCHSDRGNAQTLVAKQATSAIPIVFACRRPGRHRTGQQPCASGRQRHWPIVITRCRGQAPRTVSRGRVRGEPVGHNVPCQSSFYDRNGRGEGGRKGAQLGSFLP